MSDIFKYIDNYGNYSFKEKEFNEIDNLIFSSLVYLDYSNTLIYDNKYTIKEIGESYLKDKIELNNKELLLKTIVDKDRYKNIILYNFIHKKNSDIQFGAMTFKLTSDLIYIAFEGTEKDISCFKEDAYLACFYPIPSQIEAIKYVNNTIKLFGPKVIIGGHSKGGNLALVSSMYMKKYKQHKILRIYSNDGPGLRKLEFESNEYQKIKDKYIHIVPSESIVGVLLRNDKYYVVKTNKKCIKAHSMFNWIIDDNHLVSDKLSYKSKKLSNNLLLWLDNHDDNKRLKIVNDVFNILEEELNKSRFDVAIKKLLDIILKLKDIDNDTKYLVKDLIFSIISNKGEEHEKNN